MCQDNQLEDAPGIQTVGLEQRQFSLLVDNLYPLGQPPWHKDGYEYHAYLPKDWQVALNYHLFCISHKYKLSHMMGSTG